MNTNIIIRLAVLVTEHFMFNHGVRMVFPNKDNLKLSTNKKQVAQGAVWIITSTILLVVAALVSFGPDYPSLVEIVRGYVNKPAN